MDTATLTRITTKKTEGVTDETKVISIVEGISFQGVILNYGDFRTGQTQTSTVSYYEKKHGLKRRKANREFKNQNLRNQQILLSCRKRTSQRWYDVSTGVRRRGSYKPDTTNLVAGTYLSSFTPIAAELVKKIAQVTIRVEVYEKFKLALIPQ